MNWIGAVPAWVWWLVVVVIVGGGQQSRVVIAQGDVASARKELSDYRLEVSERDRRNAAKARTEEQRQQSIADEQGKQADEKLAEFERRYADSLSGSDSLRAEIKRLRDGRAATCDAISSQQRPAAPTASVVLGELLAELDGMAGESVKALERGRIAGLACEAIVDGMKSSGK